MINKINCFRTCILLIFCIIIQFKALSQFESYPDLDWYTIETDHFTITYHREASRSAKTVAKIAEEVYGPITSLYQYEPKDKVNFVITDVSDISNGATDFYNNRISIFASPLDFDLRGTHNWLRNVITHEFTHMIQIQASMKLSTKVPAIYLQWLNYEKERRPDVLYGYPQVIVSYPISGVGVPAWFAEGTAQYQRQQLEYDDWDSHRDMILRSYVLDNNMLTYNEMGQFSSITSLKAESIYNSGFAFVRYISRTYGENKLRDISYGLGDLTNFSIDASFRKNLKTDGNDLYDKWKIYLQNDYDEKLKNVKSNTVEGDVIENTGFANYYPHYSPDGKKLAYLSNQEYDFSTTGLFIYDLATKKKEAIAYPVASNFSWSADGKKIIYSKRNIPPTFDEIVLFDLYEYNLSTKKEKRLTTKFRATSPTYSKDGKLICFIVSRDGTLNLFISDSYGKERKALTNFNNGEEVYNPVFNKDGSKIYFDYSFEKSRKISVIDVKTGEIDTLFDDSYNDTRSPAFSDDFKKLYFSSDRTGIFNIYSYDLQSKEVKQITNVLGGAFMPSIDTGGNLAFASYKSTGYKIALLKDFKEFAINSGMDYKRPEKVIPKYATADSLSSEIKDHFDWNYLKKFDDKNIPVFKDKPYKSIFTNIAFFPVLRFDNYTKENKFLDVIKPGLYFYSDELIDRVSIFGGANINWKGDRDLFFQFTYDNGVPFFKDFFSKQLNFSPKFSLEGYNVSRQSSGELIAGLDSILVGVNYDLLEFDIGMSFKLFNYNHDFKFNYSFSKYASAIDPFIIPSSGVFVRASSEDYFKANDLSLSYFYESYYATRNIEINPIGRKIKIRYDYEVSEINPQFEVTNDGNLKTVYTTNKLNKIDGEWFESLGLFHSSHTIGLKIRGAAILGPKVDDFYDFYASGLPGMKGYPFYALGGGRVLVGNLTYRFPILTKIDTRISPLYLDKLYFGIFGDYGNAWNGKLYLPDFKKDLGAELRLQAFSFYEFPTCIFLSAAYGFDGFTKNFQGVNVTYGKEVRFYFGMLFGFDF